MDERLMLHVPAYEELGYRRDLMADPATMAYNRGYDLSFAGYDRETGCVAFPKDQWRSWYADFVGREPQAYYAYVVRRRDGAFVGEVNVHNWNGGPWHDMGVLIEARYRGLGYGAEALELLLHHAFFDMGVAAVHNDFETDRDAAVKMHLACGFREYRRENGLVELLITREAYLQRSKLRDLPMA